MLSMQLRANDGAMSTRRSAAAAPRRRRPRPLLSRGGSTDGAALDVLVQRRRSRGPQKVLSPRMPEYECQRESMAARVGGSVSGKKRLSSAYLQGEVGGDGKEMGCAMG
jgi:hypothetical protein